MRGKLNGEEEKEKKKREKSDRRWTRASIVMLVNYLSLRLRLLRNRRRDRLRPRSESRIAVVNSSQLLPVICDNIIISPLLGPKRCRPHAPGRIDDPWNRTSCRARYKRRVLIGRFFSQREYLSSRFSERSASSAPSDTRESAVEIWIGVSRPTDRPTDRENLLSAA